MTQEAFSTLTQDIRDQVILAVVAIAGCEYIERPGYHYFLIHKANCTNSIHGP